MLKLSRYLSPQIIIISQTSDRKQLNISLENTLVKHEWDKNTYVNKGRWGTGLEIDCFWYGWSSILKGKLGSTCIAWAPIFKRIYVYILKYFITNCPYLVIMFAHGQFSSFRNSEIGTHTYFITRCLVQAITPTIIIRESGKARHNKKIKVLIVPRKRHIPTDAKVGNSLSSSGINLLFNVFLCMFYTFYINLVNFAWIRVI